MKAAATSARRLLGALLLAGLLATTACSPRQVHACDDSDVGAQTCVDLQVDGPAALPEVDKLAVAVQGDWVGYAEASQRDPFRLPAAIAVVLPPTFKGKVRLAVTAYRSGEARGAGSLLVSDLQPGEHRPAALSLTPAAPVADLGTRD